MEYKMVSPAAITSFIYGGNAHFTIKSLTSGVHLSYSITKKKDGNIYFVRLNNAGSKEMSYLGYIKDNTFRLTQKSAYGADHSSVIAIKYLLASVARDHINKNMEFYHEGKCCICGRPLTDPVSIERGIGRTCLTKQ